MFPHLQTRFIIPLYNELFRSILIEKKEREREREREKERERERDTFFKQKSITSESSHLLKLS